MKSSGVSEFEIKRTDFLFLSVTLFVLALDLRLALLSLKPFHSDEGVNTHFLLQLLNEGKYVYDPQNYHGPFIYFVAYVLVKLIGLTDFALRFAPVLFSIFQLSLIFTLRRQLRYWGVLTALVLMGFSPTMTFYARTFIHETFLVSLTLATYVSLYFMLEKRNARLLIPAALGVACLITIKETFIITLACWCAAAVLSWILSVERGKSTVLPFKFRDRLEIFLVVIYLGLAVCLFLLIYLMLYSSFFANPQGPSDVLKSIFLWRDRSRADHVKEFFYYFFIMLKYEFPLLVLAAVGVVHSLTKRKFFYLFLASWTVLALLTYSLIPYKTPWLILNVLLPASLTAGAAVGDIATKTLSTKLRKQLFALLLLTVTAWTGAQSAEVNFFRYDDDRIPVVYVQTNRAFKHLFPIWNILADKYGNKTATAVFSPSYWPLPWDLRNHKTIGYYGKLAPGLEDHPFFITEDTQRVETRKIYGETHHKLEMPFTLRPGFDLYLWIRKDMWEETFGDETWRPFQT